MFIFRPAYTAFAVSVTSRRRDVLEPFDHVLARVLDRQADHALHLGYHHQAERLARQAAELRQVAR